MSEDKTTQTEATQVNPPSTEASQNNVSDGIPKTRFDEVNNKYKDGVTQNQELQAQLDKMIADKEAARKNKLEKEGEYKTLLEESNAKLEKAQVDVKAWSEYKENKRSTLMEQITEDSDKSIAESLPLEKLELYVSKVNKASSLPTNTSRAGSQKPQGDFGGYSSYVEWATKDPDGYEKENNSVAGAGIKIGYSE